MLAPWTDKFYKIPDSDLAIYNRVLPTESPLLDALELIDWTALDAQVRSFYCEKYGQPAILPLIMLKLEFLSFFYRLSDAKVIERCQTDLLFRWFLQVPICSPLPNSSSLTRFRGRLGAEGFKRVFNQLISAARAQDLLKDRLRLKDASHVLANVAIPTTLSLLAQLRNRMLDIVRQIDPQSAIGFEIKAEQVRLETAQAEVEVKLQSRLELVIDILKWLQEQPPEPPSPKCGSLWKKLAAIRHLAEKIVRDCQQPGQGDRTLSVVDSDARRGMHGNFYEGYMVDVMMDAESQLITEVEVIPANGAEANDTIHLIEMEQQTHGNQIEQISIDGCGFNGSMLRTLEDPAGLAVEVITPPAAREKTIGFAASEFQLNEDKTRVTCPGGQVSGKAWFKKEKPHSRFFNFGKKRCLACPLLSQCHPKMKETSRWGRQVNKNEFEHEYERARQKSMTAEYERVRREHPAIERKINEIVRHHGGRRARFWGLSKVRVQQIMTCFVINVKRMLKLLKGEVELCALNLQ